MNGTPPSPRATVRRVPQRADYDFEAIAAILDEAWVAHVGMAADGQPFVLPMACWREGDRLLLHGATSSRLMRHLASGAPMCVAVTLLDGLVLARSAFHHSMNYRSVVVLGRAEPLEGAAKAAALDAFVERVEPGRSGRVRRSSAQELKATMVLAVPLAEASAKVRTGGPKDDAEDLGRPVWAGVVPIREVRGEPVEDEPKERPGAGGLAR